MKPHLLIAGTAALLLLSACQTTSDDETRLRRGKLVVPVDPREAAFVPSAVPPARVTVVSAPVATPPHPPVVVAAPTPPPAPIVVPAPAPVPVVVASPASPPVPDLPPGIRGSISGNTAKLSWTLPSGMEFRAIEIMRNTQEQPMGRTRIRAVRASVTEMVDIVPDSLANYWYWLKVTGVNGEVENYGPVRVSSEN